MLFKMLLYFFLIILMLEAKSNANSSHIPEQFRSDEAAIILGLENKKIITKKSVTAAFKSLMKKYHPDKYIVNKSNLTLEDLNFISNLTLEDLNFISKQLNMAKSRLLEHIKSNSQNVGDSNIGNTNKSKYNSKPWSEGNISNGNNLELHFGLEKMLENTLFNFKLDDVSTIILHLDSNQIVDNGNRLVIVFNKNTFPIMEARFYKINNSINAKSPIIETILPITYKLNYHRGGSSKKFDALVFEDGSYLLPKDGFNYILKKMKQEPNGIYEGIPISNGKITGFGSMFNNTPVFSLKAGEEFQEYFAKHVSDNVFSEDLSWKRLKVNNPMETTKLPPPVHDETIKSIVDDTATFIKSDNIKWATLISESIRNNLNVNKEILSSAIGLIKKGIEGVSNVNLEDRPTQEINDVEIIINFSTLDEINKELIEFYKKGYSNNTISLNKADAFTSLIDNKLVVFLALDLILYKKNGAEIIEHPNSFSNLVTVLSHEIYGNAFSFIDRFKTNDLFGLKQTFVPQQQQEVISYSRGIKLLESILKLNLPDTVRNGLQTSLDEERKRLEGWETQHGSSDNKVTKMNPRCNSLFKRN